MADTSGSSATFDLLASEIRLSIVRALGDEMAGGEHSPLAFSTLQERVDVDDNGKFNYHLQRLEGHFVERTDGGYQLRVPGVQVYQAIKSGQYDPNVTVEETRIDDCCVECGDRFTVRYEDGRFVVRCPDCGTDRVRYPLSTGAFDPDDLGSLLEAGHRRLWRDSESMRRRICPYCSGSITATLDRDTTPVAADADSFIAHFSCDQCHWFIHTAAAGVVATHPAVVSFLYDRGLVLEDEHAWAWPIDVEEAVRSTDPLRVAFTYRYREDSLTLVADEAVEIDEIDGATEKS